MIDAFRLDGRPAVVTGGANGIGRGIAGVLATAGARVIVADRDHDAIARAVKELRADGHAAEAMPLDLTDEADVARACADLVARIGAPWLLVNNAGLQDRAMLLDTTVDEWDRMQAVNARGPFLMIRELGGAMARGGVGGRIVNIASNVVLAPMVNGLAAYAASKSALVALGMQAAFELAGHGITVNAVLPGGVATAGARAARGPAPAGPASSRRPPLGMCEPHDIGAAVLFFATPAARYITNQTIAVDAGFSLT